MATITNLSTSQYSVINAQNFVDEITSGNNNYYLFAGTPVPYTSGIIPQPRDDVYDTCVNLYRNMLFGKSIDTTDVKLMIPNYPWTYGTVYSQYDDSDPLLTTKQFYSIVNATSYYHVFKCIDNNNGSPSTISPDFADVSSLDTSYVTADGYRWKYMYSVDSTTVGKFSTLSYFPYVANNTVIDNAVSGSIDNIIVNQSGNGYSNYLNGTFSINDIRLLGNNTLYAVSANASVLPTFYNGCIIYITADPYGNSAGQFKTVQNYSVNSTCKWIEIDSPFTNVPQNGAQYQIYPGVIITGDGNQSTNAIAWAVVNNSTNTINNVEMLKNGVGYTYLTANVVAANSVGVGSPASIRPLYAPPGGHGSNPAAELGAKSVCIAVNFINNDNLITNTNYQTIGILKNPTFSNVVVYMSNTNGNFLGSEPVYTFTKTLLGGTANVQVGNNIISGIGTDFRNQFSNGDYIYITSSNTNQLLIVNSTINATSLSTTTNSNIISNNMSIYKANVMSTGYTAGISAGQITLDSVTAPLNQGDRIIGFNSGALGTVNYVVRSGITKDFSTFIQTHQYQGPILAGSFVQNEIISVSSQTISNGFLAGIIGSNTFSTMYVTNQIGVFNTSANVVGSSSQAVLEIVDKYNPEVDYGSGEVLYVENINSINRQETYTENFQLIFQY